jgi:regulatory protein
MAYSLNKKGSPPSDNPADSAKGYALRLLSIKGRSERELRERLKKKGYDTDTIETVISHVKKYNYINDRALAEELLSFYLEKKNMGRRGIKALLIKRGIPGDVINSFNLDEIDEIEGAMRIARKRLKSYDNLAEERARSRVAGLLRRRGHSSETIKYVLDEIFTR